MSTLTLFNLPATKTVLAGGTLDLSEARVSLSGVGLLTPEEYTLTVNPAVDSWNNLLGDHSTVITASYELVAPGAPENLESTLTPDEAPGIPGNLQSTLVYGAPGIPGNLQSTLIPDAAPGIPGNLQSTLSTAIPIEPVPGSGSTTVTGVAITQMFGATYYIDSASNLMLLGFADAISDGNGNAIPPFRYYTPQLVDSNVTEIYSGTTRRGLAYKKNNDLLHFNYNSDNTSWRNPTFLDIGQNIIRYSANGSLDSILWVRSDNSLWGVGSNASGELMNGQIVGGAPALANNTQIVANGVIDAAVGSAHGMYLTSTGDLYTAGSNLQGQLGQGNPNSSNITPTIAATNVIRCFAGERNSYFINNNNTLFACGEGQYGANGQVNRLNQNNWVQVATNVADVYPGVASCLFKKTDNTLWGFGSGLTLSTIGAGMEIDHTPVQFATSVRSAASETNTVTPSQSAFVFQKTDNSLWGWGYNDGRLGPQTGQDAFDGTVYANPVTLKRST